MSSAALSSSGRGKGTVPGLVDESRMGGRSEDVPVASWTDIASYDYDDIDAVGFPINAEERQVTERGRTAWM